MKLFFTTLLLFTNKASSSAISSSRLFATQSRSSSSHHHYHHQQHQLPHLHYRIRPATKNDIPRIDQCNRANLPENYSHLFYSSHLDRFADLSLVAETDQAELIGYALGRIERDEEDFFRNLSDFASPVTYHGHVASVAVNAPYRKHGVAKALMEELHRRFVSLYNVDSVDLYCRVSNEAAIRLYSEVFSYGRAKLEVAYYEDQEDAWQMRMTGLRELFNGNKASFSSSYGEKSQHKRFLQS
eukprot:gene4998-5489_t